MRKKSYWYVPGHSCNIQIAIKVYKVEQSSNKIPLGGYVFWWMSEPIGHSITDNDLMTKVQARRELAARKKEAWESKISFKKYPKLDNLHDWRVNQARFIMSTHPKEDRMPVKKFLSEYPPEEETEWFN